MRKNKLLALGLAALMAECSGLFHSERFGG